ncbi:S-DNA-T family DNA segregation ATPase FtsK/SpoIIIE [Geodermatophilus tzadiensis]|uniref:S-DNA-T family DNA segregation ATPase FtsK/SpoIIIE n=1 Tax=Geodermatophilus tzadiensis TaxID=1137988 RepID=A0A2T0U1X6_9ACTN|nr:FtsK/SpoIIIE domain-containing protein [Geodermatophilus tzadiensis]PRY51828.1 S-DNA-T family DNA segregation ATPase FtsK/SpoIIIE [Geodermatophilus tzadiensis]
MPDVPLAAELRCWTVVGPAGPVDVEVRAADHARLDTVLPVLAAALGAPAAGLWSGSSRLADDLPLDDAALAHGAVLGLGRPAARPGTPGQSPLELHVVGGPAAGTTVPLVAGRHVLGRGTAAMLPLPDAGVSRQHVVLDVGAGGISVTDLGSTNGSRLDDADLGPGPRDWPAGTVLRLGSSSLAVTGPRDGPAGVRPAPAGRVSLQAAPRPVPLRPEVEVRLPDAPVAASRRRLAWVAVVLPAAAGVTMAWLLSAPTFLFFALLSPIVAVATWLSDRWSGSRGGRRAAAVHAEETRVARARLAEAVRADVRAARATSPDLATLATAARRRTGLLWHRGAADAGTLVVRLGTGAGVTRVRRVEEGRREPETAADLPVTVDLRRTGGLAVTGPRGPALDVVAGVLAQLVTLSPPGDVDVAVLTTARRLADWAWARWMPHLSPGAVHVRPDAAEEAAAADAALLSWLRGVASGGPRPRAGDPGAPARPRPARWLVVLVDRPVDPALRAALRDCREAGVVVLGPADRADELAGAEAVLQVAGETGDTGLLDGDGADRTELAVDRLPRAVAARLARDLAPLAPVRPSAGLPAVVRLLDLVGGGPGAPVAPEWSRDRGALRARLGIGVDGVVEVDLCRDGPHALVAGTTGSGKSELLRTLVAALALAHPPDRCSFLLVDYKGGAAFAEAVALPHTVGVVTDLDGAATARALRSLTAELVRREAVLAAAGVADVAALPADVALARLVIVVDEFAGLAETLPELVSGLVGIAQRGRSLGVHLVLATQRPGGVVSPEIRANCSLRLCLRTTGEADSRDVLGGPEAAAVPVDRPGRGFLRIGSDRPVPFQSARVALADPEEVPGPAVRRWAWPVVPPPPPDREEPAAGPSALSRVTAAVTAHARAAGLPPPHRPWQPPLPGRIDAAELGGAGRAPTELLVGLVDHPDRQRREPLVLDLARGGGWLAVGGPRSGRTTLLRTVLAEAVDRLPPGGLHVHVLDHGGGALAAEAARLPHTGTVVEAADALRTVRLLARLTEHTAARRAGGVAPGPAVLLLVDGVESLVAQLDEAVPGSGSADLLRLVRDGAAAGLTCVLTGDRAVPGGRLAAAAGTRLVLPLPDRADYAVAGVPVRAVPAERPPGRALLGEQALECQLALPRPLRPAAGRSLGPAPVRIPLLPPDPRLSAAEADGGPDAVPLGPGGDEGAVLRADLRRGGGLLIVGPPRSGRTTTLDALATTLLRSGTAVARLVTGRRATGRGPAGATALAADDPAGWRSWLAALGGPGAVLLDDAGTLADCAVVASMTTAGLADADVVVLAAGTAGELSAAFRGPVADLRRSRSGLLLCPGPGDADLLGTRLPRTPVPVRPGSGWVVTAGTAQRVQVARHRGPARAGGAGDGPAGNRAAA